MTQLGFGFAEIARIPERRPAPARRPRAVGTQLELGIAPSRGAKLRVEAHLRRILGPYVLVTLTENVSTMISIRRKGRALYLRCHAMFGEAPDAVLDALAAFVSKDAIEPGESTLLDAWIERHRALLDERRAAQPTQPHGEHHDLEAMFARLNAQYFGGAIDARITWSVAATKKKRRSMKLGSYATDQRLIRMHPALDQEWVPAYFVEFVVFHEMLHQVHGVSEEGCARAHPPAFRADERRFERFREATRWEHRHLARLLKY